MTEERVYTPEEVARHNTEKDLWMTIHGHAYDLTKFLKEHPGGEEVLMHLAGQDGTTCFDDIGHSQEALQLRDGLRVGRVVPGDSPPGGGGGGGGQSSAADGPQVATIDDDNWTYEEPKSESSSMLPAFVAVGAVIYGVVFYYVFWNK